jgi:hypothetical protein
MTFLKRKTECKLKPKIEIRGYEYWSKKGKNCPECAYQHFRRMKEPPCVKCEQFEKELQDKTCQNIV